MGRQRRDLVIMFVGFEQILMANHTGKWLDFAVRANRFR
jgi:hypothetical protein